MEYQSYKTVASRAAPGVSFRIARMSFGRRMELARSIRELAHKLEYLEAGETAGEKMDAALLAAEIDRIYLCWGLLEVAGLDVDGTPATAESLAAAGPEDVFREALGAVKAECGLSEEERKN
jgi:hypothetical protein